MDLRALILELFEYDLWANREWILASEAINGNMVLSHVVSAQEIWLGRIKNTIEAKPEEPLSERLTQINEAWTEYLTSADLDLEITYQSFKGETFKNTVAEIAMHVVNHGTYHRGDLRGRCAVLGSEQFPETDMIAYTRSRR